MMKFKHKKKGRYLMIGAEALQRSLQNLSEICSTELPNLIVGTFDNKMKESEESGNLEGGIDYGETD